MVKRVTEPGIRLHVQTLIDTPQRIRACTRGVDEARLSTAPGPGEWAAAAIMAHLRACAEVWSTSIYAMLSEDQRVLAYIHPRDWIKQRGYAALGFAANFEAFEEDRTELVRVLERLSFEQWSRSARLTGKANVYTVFGETLRMARHDAEHCHQLEAMFPPAQP